MELSSFTLCSKKLKKGACEHKARMFPKMCSTMKIDHSPQIKRLRKTREIKGLVNACKNFGLKTGTIVTYDTEDEVTQEGIQIKLIPFYRWIY